MSLTLSSPQRHGCLRALRALRHLRAYDLDTSIWLFLCLLLIYVALFQISSLFFFELFLVTSAVAHARAVTWYQLRHCIKSLIKNIIKIFFTRKSYFFKTFFYKEHVKKDLMHYSALIVNTFFIILIRTWVSLLSGKRNL